MPGSGVLTSSSAARPGRAYAGPFTSLRVDGSLSSRTLTAARGASLHARLDSDQRGRVTRRAGRARYTVGVLFPSWGGAAASVDSPCCADGARVAVGAGRIPLASIAYLSVRSALQRLRRRPRVTSRGRGRAHAGRVAAELGPGARPDRGDRDRPRLALQPCRCWPSGSRPCTTSRSSDRGGGSKCLPTRRPASLAAPAQAARRVPASPGSTSARWRRPSRSACTCIGPGYAGSRCGRQESACGHDSPKPPTSAHLTTRQVSADHTRVSLAPSRLAGEVLWLHRSLPSSLGRVRFPSPA